MHQILSNLWSFSNDSGRRKKDKMPSSSRTLRYFGSGNFGGQPMQTRKIHECGVVIRCFTIEA